MRLAVYDREAEYIYAFVTYVLEYRSEEVELYAFTEKEALFQYEEEQIPDVLLISMAEDSEEIQNLRAKVQMFLVDGELREGSSEKICISKYQSADEILRQIYWQYEKNVVETGQWVTNEHGCQLHWVYSPGKNLYQTPFALTLATYAAQSKKVLYLNLCENAAFDWMFQKNYEKDLSDYMYLSRTKKGFSEKLLSSVIYHEQGVDFIAPMTDSLERQYVTEEEWINVILQLKYYSGYEELIVDCDSMIPGFAVLMKECSQIYLPIQEGSYEGAKVRHFYNWLEKSDGQSQGQFQQVHLPKMYLNFAGEEMLNQWMFGELGEVVRGLV